jgi:hypothetical protein
MRARAELLQWFGVLGAPLAWAGQLVVGFYVADLHCSPGQRVFAVDNAAWQAAAMGIALAIALAAEAAAVTVFRQTRGVELDGDPPWSRRRFFVWASVLGNVLFVVAILLSGVAAIHHSDCQVS